MTALCRPEGRSKLFSVSSYLSERDGMNLSKQCPWLQYTGDGAMGGGGGYLIVHIRSIPSTL